MKYIKYEYKAEDYRINYIFQIYFINLAFSIKSAFYYNSSLFPHCNRIDYVNNILRRIIKYFIFFLSLRY
ncbi:unnamed protein product [marine sediment metagenome]|uniref:Uncharacterized protein n=1 Tax=marine sediment metagenome TaxID=412755 RepID=X1CEU5_9ZZZZ